MSKIKFLILLLFLFPLKSSAQEYGEGLSHHQAGIAGSSLSSYGATYSYIFNSDYRIKSTVFAFYEDHDTYYDWIGTLGLEFQITLESASVTRFYGLIGGNYFRFVTSNVYNNSYYSTYRSEKDYAIGVGIGFELLAWKHLVFNLDGTLQYTVMRDDDYNYPYLTRYFGPGIGGGINYRF